MVTLNKDGVWVRKRTDFQNCDVLIDLSNSHSGTNKQGPELYSCQPKRTHWDLIGWKSQEKS
jgi:hypothetical protein